ncbi:MAG: hypothetical protein KC635_27275 [Myxococcales bacterium]|nr:hypothetical protein [Myxococcales bacterium]MCB9735056.1 hypothetical protein [Deltaproteobacteria bacterium]
MTFCIEGKVCLLGRVVAGRFESSGAGDVVAEVWESLPSRFSGLACDTLGVMPNHVHAIMRLDVSLGLDDDALRGPEEARRATLGEIVGAWKSLTTLAYGKGVREAGWPPFRGRLWQRSYFDHVIRDEASFAAIRAYIQTNPARWGRDPENPARGSERDPW